MLEKNYDNNIVIAICSGCGLPTINKDDDDDGGGGGGGGGGGSGDCDRLFI